MITKQEFTNLYTQCLTEAVQAKPSDFMFGVDKVPGVADKMVEAISTGTFNHDGEGLRRLCKTLSIKHTRKSIIEYYRKNVTS